MLPVKQLQLGQIMFRVAVHRCSSAAAGCV
jgi:hypothetical protein